MDKKTKVSMQIESIVRDNPETTYMEAILIYANNNDLELDNITKYISPSLKDKLRAECRKKNLLKASPVVSIPDSFFE